MSEPTEDCIKCKNIINIDKNDNCLYNSKIAMIYCIYFAFFTHYFHMKNDSNQYKFFDPCETYAQRIMESITYIIVVLTGFCILIIPFILEGFYRFFKYIFTEVIVKLYDYLVELLKDLFVHIKDFLIYIKDHLMKIPKFIKGLFVFFLEYVVYFPWNAINAYNSIKKAYNQLYGNETVNKKELFAFIFFMTVIPTIFIKYYVY